MPLASLMLVQPPALMELKIKFRIAKVMVTLLLKMYAQAVLLVTKHQLTMIQFIQFADKETGVVSTKVDVNGEVIVAVETLLQRTESHPMLPLLVMAVGNPRALSEKAKSLLLLFYGDITATITKVTFHKGEKDLKGVELTEDKTYKRLQSVKSNLSENLFTMFAKMAMEVQTSSTNNVVVD